MVDAFCKIINENINEYIVIVIIKISCGLIFHFLFGLTKIIHQIMKKKIIIIVFNTMIFLYQKESLCNFFLRNFLCDLVSFKMKH